MEINRPKPSPEELAQREKLFANKDQQYLELHFCGGNLETPHSWELQPMATTSVYAKCKFCPQTTVFTPAETGYAGQKTRRAEG